MALLLVLALFLTIQNRIDEKDPKLALAPVYGEPDLAFAADLSRGDRHT
jgi:hypothetical protein